MSQVTSPIPTGQEVEYLAIALAAVDGVIWLKADADAATRYRRYANACLTRLGMAGQHAGAAHIHRTCTGSAMAMRQASLSLDEKHNDEEIKNLIRYAALIEMIPAIVTGENDAPETSEGDQP